MFRLNQFIRISLIRLEGLLYQIFGFLSQLFAWLNQRFNFLKKLFGFTESQYFLEDSAQGIKQAEAKSDMAESAPQYSPPTASSTRRRPVANIDYFRKLARQAKTSS